MRNSKCSLLAGAAILVASVGVAQAAEPIALSESQMDKVTAGWTFEVAGPADFFKFTYMGATVEANPMRGFKFDSSN